MSVLADWQIEELSKTNNMIVPYSEGVKREGVISYGVTSYGYDVRVGYKFKVFDPIGGTEIDPKNFDPNALREIDLMPRKHDFRESTEINGSLCCIRKDCSHKTRMIPKVQWDDPCGVAQPPNFIRIPPHSFVLAETVEEFDIPRDILCVVLGKSTYARCGLIVNVTPGEPEWKGRWTVELSNTTPLPLRVYAGEGIMQVLFLRADGVECAILDAVLRILKGSDKTLEGEDIKEGEWFNYVNNMLHRDLPRNLCRKSYKDKAGKYQGQVGLTLPIVDQTNETGS